MLRIIFLGTCCTWPGRRVNLGSFRFFFLSGFLYGTAPTRPNQFFYLYFSAAHMKTDLPPSVRTKNGRVHRCSASFFAPVALWPAGRIVIGSFKRLRFLYGRHRPQPGQPVFFALRFFPRVHTQPTPPKHAHQKGDGCGDENT